MWVLQGGVTLSVLVLQDSLLDDALDELLNDLLSRIREDLVKEVKGLNIFLPCCHSLLGASYYLPSRTGAPLTMQEWYAHK